MCREREIAIVPARWPAVRRIARLTLALIAAATSATPSLGGEPPSAGVWSLSADDDIVAGSDRYYTGGFALTWVPTSQPPPEWAVYLARSIPWIQGASVVRPVYALGQSVFTPRDITLANPPLDDRPYAGWLWGAIGLDVETERQSDQLSLTLGVVGPASLAEQIQSAIHRITRSPAPQGWETQLHDEFGVALTYQHAWRGLASGTLAGLPFDLLPYVGGAVGNVSTYANAGLTVRWGTGLSSDFGPLRIRPGPPGSAFFVPASATAWYVFAGLDGRAVARNIFLDGNTFQDSRNVDKNPLVGDLEAGVEITWQDVRLSYTQVFRTREFKTQGASARFGALSVSVAY